MICIPHHILLRLKNTERWAGHVTRFVEVRNANLASELQNPKIVCRSVTHKS